MAQQEYMAKKQRAEEETSTEHWFGGLRKLKPGLEYIDHIAHVEMVQSGRSNECPDEQAAEFRTVLLAGLNRDVRNFNMPSTLPKFIVVCNLSGLRRLYYSNSHKELVTLLTKPPSAASDVSRKVEDVIKYAETNGLSLLLSFSLPYQAGCDRAFWELRTLCHTPEKGIVDGQRGYDSSKARPSQVGCSKDAAANIPDVVIQAQIERFRMQMSAVDMDYEEVDTASDETGGTAAGATSEEASRDRLEAKVGLLNVVLKQKEKTFKEEVEDLRLTLASAEGEHAAKVAGIEARMASMEVSLNDRLNDAKRQVASLTREKGEKIVELDNVRQDLKWAADSHATELQQLVDAQKGKDVELKSLRRFKNEADRRANEAAKARAGEDTELVAPYKDRERNLEERIAELDARCKQRDAQANQLGLVVDTLSNEKQGLVNELRDKESARRSLLVRLVMSLLRQHENDQREEAARASKARVVECGVLTDIMPETLRTGELEQQVVTLKDERQVLKEVAAQVEPLRSKLNEALSHSAELSEQLDKLQVQLAASEKRAADAAAASAAAPPHAATPPLSPSVAHAGDAARLGDLPSAPVQPQHAPQAASSPVDSFDASMMSAYCSPHADVMGACSPGHSYSNTFNFNVGSPMQHLHDGGGMPMPFDHMVDPGTEHMIMQLQSAVRSVCDLARTAAHHNHNAKDAWSQLRAIQAHSMHAAQASPQLPNMLHGPPPNSRRGGGAYHHSQHAQQHAQRHDHHHQASRRSHARSGNSNC